MASNKSSMKGPKSSGSGASLAGTLIKILAIGVAGGAALIGGAKKLGEEIEKTQKLEYLKKENMREAQRDAALAAAAADEENIEETAKEVFAEPEADEETKTPEAATEAEDKAEDKEASEEATEEEEK